MPARVVGIVARTKKPCSDPYCCGNHRRWGKERLTRAEVAAKLSAEEQLA